MIIAIHGAKRSGKDTLFERLTKYSSLKVKRFAFADIPKQILGLTLGLTPEGVDSFMKEGARLALKHEGCLEGEHTDLVSMREAMQTFTTEAMMPVFGQKVWADLVRAQIQKFDHGYTDEYLVGITDLRFEHELDSLMHLPDYTFTVKITGGFDDSHASNQGLPDKHFDLLVDNSVRDDDFQNLDAHALNILQEVSRF